MKNVTLHHITNIFVYSKKKLKLKYSLLFFNIYYAANMYSALALALGLV